MFDTALTFTPLYQTRVWGGRRLETLLGRTLPDSSAPYGESWEISDRPLEQSACTLADGSSITLHELWQRHREEVFGTALSQHPSPSFPLLIKVLDACDDLSIQVHPPAAVAAELKGEPKTEMWFVAHAEPGAKLYAGLRDGVTRADFEQSIRDGKVADCVQVLEPRAGDCLFIPSGLIHAIGAGLVIYEVQQNSDTTYRVFDWNRVGLDGNPRELHVEESLKSIDFQEGPPTLQRPDDRGLLVSCEFFEVREALTSPKSTLGQQGGNLVVAMISGQITSAGKTLRQGDFALIPACLPDTARRISEASSEARWLEIRIPAR